MRKFENVEHKILWRWAQWVTQCHQKFFRYLGQRVKKSKSA